MRFNIPFATVYKASSTNATHTPRFILGESRDAGDQASKPERSPQERGSSEIEERARGKDEKAAERVG